MVICVSVVAICASSVSLAEPPPMATLRAPPFVGVPAAEPDAAGEASPPESLLPQAAATEPNAATAPTAAAPLSRPRRVTRLSLTTS